jgi:cytochrome c oxidase subunit 2
MDHSTLDRRAPARSRPLTTRRGFVAAASFGAVSLYGLWAVFGAAPLRFSLGRDADHGAGHTAPAEEPAAAGHGGHGAATGPTPEEFRRLTEDFIAKFQRPDGSVEPGITPAPADPHAGHGSGPKSAASADPHAAHGGGDEMRPTATQVVDSSAEAPVEVYVLAQQWSFGPAVLHLRTGVTYRFRMMATDVSHGASLQLGVGSQIIRLRRGVMVEREMTFTRPGTYLVYCTVYCGLGHDRMAGTIIVA